MSYTHDLIAIASKFEQPMSVEYSKDKNLYRVSIDKVHFKDGHARKKIFGQGSTIEDACCDFIRLARGGEIIHFLTDVSVVVV